MEIIKEQEAKGLLGNLLGEKIPILGAIPFINTLFQKYKMNTIVNKFLLAGDRFMPEMHLRQPGVTYRACSPFTKNKERIKRFKETGDSRYIYQNKLDKNKERIKRFKETGDSRYIYQKKLDKVCFQHDMAYGDFKDLTRRTAADKVLRDKAFNIAKDTKCDGYQRGLASIVYKFFDKKISGSGIKNENISDKELAEELQKLIIRKFNKRKAHSSFIDNIWGADLADMQLISKFNKGFRFLLCVVDIYSKYAWVIPLKDKKRGYNY